MISVTADFIVEHIWRGSELGMHVTHAVPLWHLHLHMDIRKVAITVIEELNCGDENILQQTLSRHSNIEIQHSKYEYIHYGHYRHLVCILTSGRLRSWSLKNSVIIMSVWVATLIKDEEDLMSAPRKAVALTRGAEQRAKNTTYRSDYSTFSEYGEAREIRRRAGKTGCQNITPNSCQQHAKGENTRANARLPE